MPAPASLIIKQGGQDLPPGLPGTTPCPVLQPRVLQVPQVTGLLNLTQKQFPLPNPRTPRAARDTYLPSPCSALSSAAGLDCCKPEGSSCSDVSSMCLPPGDRLCGESRDCDQRAGGAGAVNWPGPLSLLSSAVTSVVVRWRSGCGPDAGLRRCCGEVSSSGSSVLVPTGNPGPDSTSEARERRCA